MNKRILFIILLSSVLIFSISFASTSFEFFLGDAINIPTPLTIILYDTGVIYTTGIYETRAFTFRDDANYYAYRFSFNDHKREWYEFELIHHKIYLINTPEDFGKCYSFFDYIIRLIFSKYNPPEEIQYFNISHGYNLITINKAWKDKNINWLIYRLGLGVVLAHPQSKIKGEEWSYVEGTLFGFLLAGPAIQGSMGTRHHIGKFFVSTELKITLAYAVVPVIKGSAHVPNIAVHFLGGFGYSF
ncbi:MAG: hypothetical protein ABDH25_04230 [Dictyoglomaceae bacterium]